MKKKLKRKILIMLVTSDTDSIISFLAKNMSVTRAGTTVNPLETYNYVGAGQVFKNNEMVTTKGIAVDVAKSKTYDFANKVAGTFDLVNCPMKIYVSKMSTLQNPTNFTDNWATGWDGWWERNQTQINYIKSIGNGSINESSNNAGDILQFMVELDLTDLANKYGGNANFKNMLSAITVDCYAKGSGAGGNGVTVQIWDNVNTNWGKNLGWWYTNSNSSSITKITTGAGAGVNGVTTSNKFYIMINSQFASDGSTPSSVSLDYISVKIDYLERNFTKDGAGFIGGDTDEYTYSFETKVANSNLECPMKIYMYTPQSPTNAPTGAWWNDYENSQAYIDKLKLQDGNSILLKTSDMVGNLAGYYAMMMVELDLTPIANVVGGNNSLKSLLKSINVDCFAMGSGANAGVLANGVNAKIWYANSSWDNYDGVTSAVSTSGAISKLTFKDTRAGVQLPSWITPSNKLYILIASQYPSDGVISSSVSLDYLKVTVQLNRVPDTVTSIPVNLPKYFGAVLRGFSPAWTYDVSSDSICLCDISKDSNNRIGVWYYPDSDKFGISSIFNGVETLLRSNVQNFSKYQVYNIIFGVNSIGMVLYLLKNNDVLQKVTNSNINNINGLANLYIGKYSYNTSYNSKAFLDNLTLIDLEKAGKVKAIVKSEVVYNPTTWAEWSKILNGGTINGDSTGIEFTSGGTWQRILFNTNLKPSTKYGFLYTVVSNNRSAGIVVDDNSAFGNNFAIPSTIGNQKITKTTLSTISNNNITIYAFADTVGLKIKFKDIRLFELPIGSEIESDFNTLTADQLATKYQYSADGISRQDLLTDGEALSILKGQMHIKENSLVVNGDFSQGTSGWTVQGTSSVSNNECTFTATGQYASLNQAISNYSNYKNHIMYSCAYVKSDTNNISLIFNDGIGQAFKSHTGSGNYEFLSVMRTVSSSATQILSLFQDNRASGWTPTKIKQVNVIDLTALFGAGLEPTLAQCDLMFSQGSTNPINLVNSELFDINQVVLHANASRSNGVITLNASASWQNSYIDIPALPNNRYELKATINNTTNGLVEIDEYYNSINLNSNGTTRIGYSPIGNGVFVTKPITNKIRIYFGNSTTGTFTYSNISLKRKD